MSSSLVIRDATETDREAAVTLLTSAHGSVVRDAAAWDWLFRGRLGRYVVADAGDHLAAQYALLPTRVRHRGELIDASLSLDTATHPDYGGRGLMTELGQLAYERAGNNLVLGFPNGNSAWILYNRLGWHEIAPFPLQIRLLPGVLRAFTGAGIALPSRQMRTTRAESFDRFGAWADDIWEANAHGLTTSVVRDRGYLNWRFIDAPYRYERFVALAGGEPAAYAVVRTVAWRRGRFSYLMELAGFPGAVREARVVLNAAIANARAAGSAGLGAIVTERNPLSEILRGAGFRTAPPRVRAGFSFGVRATGDLAMHDELARWDGWYVTAGDFDHI